MNITRPQRPQRDRAPVSAAGRRATRPTKRGVEVLRGTTPDTIVIDVGKRRNVPERMTATQFATFAWPAHQRWELIEGVPVMAPSPVGKNQTLLGVLTAFLVARFSGWVVTPEFSYQPPGHRTYLTPDLMLIRADEDYDEEQVPYTGTPALTIEIISPSNAPNDWVAKRRIYAEAGVPEYWIIDPTTCAVWINFDPKDGAYSESSVDDDGFAYSPLLDLGVSLRRRRPTFVIDTADRPADAPASKPARKTVKKTRRAK